MFIIQVDIVRSYSQRPRYRGAGGPGGPWPPPLFSDINFQLERYMMLRILAEQPKAPAIHCQGHTLSLAVKQLTSSCKILGDTNQNTNHDQ